MVDQAQRYIHAAYIGCLSLLLLCFLLLPEGLWANNGISYFGVHPITLLPYSLAFLFGAVCLIMAAQAISPDPSMRPLVWSLRIFAASLAGLILTPDDLPILGTLHLICGSLLFALQLAVSLWLLTRFYDAVAAMWAFFMLLAGIACFYYLPHPTGFLAEGELIYQACFWAFISRVLIHYRPPASTVQPEVAI